MVTRRNDFEKPYFPAGVANLNFIADLAVEQSLAMGEVVEM